MRNFILFIIVVAILSFTGYIVYRVYYQGESLDTALQEFRSEPKTDVLAEAKEAYKRGEYTQAARDFELALQACESGEPGAELTEREHRTVLARLAGCYKRMWENGGKTDDTLRFKALRYYEKYQKEYPGYGHRNIGRSISELQHPATAPVAETTDPSPPK